MERPQWRVLWSSEAHPKWEAQGVWVGWWGWDWRTWGKEKGYSGTWPSSCILAWNPSQLYQAPLWKCEQMAWGLYHCGPSLQSGKHRAGTTCLGLSMPVARACESILLLPRASILSAPSLLQMVSLLKTTPRFLITRQACTSLEYKLTRPITRDKL